MKYWFKILYKHLFFYYIALYYYIMSLNKNNILTNENAILKSRINKLSKDYITLKLENFNI